MDDSTPDPLIEAAENMGSNLHVSEHLAGDRVTVHAFWDVESYQTTSRGPTHLLVELDKTANPSQTSRGINASVMQRVSRAVVAMSEEMHEDAERGALARAREIAARLPAPKVDRTGYLSTLLELHAELSRLGRPQVINDIRDLVLETQRWLIPKGTLRTHLYQARERIKED